MIISCISCGKKFNVNSELIPSNGRTIQCGSCNHIWFYNPKKIIDTINEHKKTKGFYVGIEKIIKNINGPKKSKKWYRDIIDILVNKNILKRVQKSFGCIITNGPINISDLSPTLKYSLLFSSVPDFTSK